MGKTYRFDPKEYYGGDNLPPKSKKELKAERRAKHAKDIALDDQMKSDDDDNRDDGLIR